VYHRREALLVALFVGAFAVDGAAQGDQEASVEKGAQPPPELPPLEIQIDKQRVDLDKHRLEVRMSRPAGRVELKVYDEMGILVAEVNQSFEGKPARAPLVVRWEPSSNEPVGKIEVYAFDKYEYYKAVAIIPWSFSIPHEEVEFENNSWEILPTEEPKLEASFDTIRGALKKYEDLGEITLFIAGHTDTKGAPQHNKNLSRMRARSIAKWFRDHGLKLPIAYEGFGESALKMKTADEVDEPQNRRVDYVLSVELPRFKSSGGAPAWKRL
jgi:outer membrane protein OmpA-like peptidoglycan-associated protein